MVALLSPLTVRWGLAVPEKLDTTTVVAAEPAPVLLPMRGAKRDPEGVDAYLGRRGDHQGESGLSVMGAVRRHSYSVRLPVQLRMHGEKPCVRVVASATPRADSMLIDRRMSLLKFPHFACNKVCKYVALGVGCKIV